MELTVPFTSYKYLRFLALVAGLLGLAQSLAWLGMAIVALVSYNCSIPFTGVGANYGNILRLTLFNMYFRGNCTPNGFPTVEFTSIDGLDLTTSSNVYIWMWVVASLSLLWLFSSVTLITNVKKSNIRHINVFLYIWILITFVISMIDLVLFILFIIDYNTIMQFSYNIPLDWVVSTRSILVTAQNTSGMLASIALRGYLLWIINLSLTVYLFTQTFRVYDHNRMNVNKTGQDNNGFTRNDDIKGHSIYNNQPIQAYESNLAKPNLPWYNYLTTDIPRVQRPQSLVRSKSATNLDESFQQRMTMTTAHPDSVVFQREQVQRELRDRQSVNNSSLGNYQTPQNNYETRPQLRSAMRNSRYQ